MNDLCINIKIWNTQNLMHYIKCYSHCLYIQQLLHIMICVIEGRTSLEKLEWTLCISARYQFGLHLKKIDSHPCLFIQYIQYFNGYKTTYKEGVQHVYQCQINLKGKNRRTEEMWFYKHYGMFKELPVIISEVCEDLYMVYL